MKGWLLEGTSKPDQTGKLIFRPAFIDTGFPLFLMGGSAIWWRYCRRFFVHWHVPGFVTPFTTLWPRGETWQSMVERQHSEFTVVLIRLSLSLSLSLRLSFPPPLRHSSLDCHIIYRSNEIEYRKNNHRVWLLAKGGRIQGERFLLRDKNSVN